MAIATEIPLSTPVASIWHQTVNVLLFIREAHEDGGEMSGESSEYAWNFDATKGLLTVQMCLDQYGELSPDELHRLNFLPEHRGQVQFLNGDVEGEFQARVVARHLPELATEEMLDRAEQMLNGGTV